VLVCERDRVRPPWLLLSGCDRRRECERNRGGLVASVTALPSEAREGLMRVWLELLREKHPGVSWLAVEPDTETARRDARQRRLAAAEKAKHRQRQPSANRVRVLAAPLISPARRTRS
jgi:hypothetical protein